MMIHFNVAAFPFKTIFRYFLTEPVAACLNEAPSFVLMGSRKEVCNCFTRGVNFIFNIFFNIYFPLVLSCFEINKRYLSKRNFFFFVRQDPLLDYRIVLVESDSME